MYETIKFPVDTEFYCAAKTVVNKQVQGVVFCVNYIRLENSLF